MGKVNYIFPHLGLGDYLIVNGLIRSIIKPDQEYILFTNKNYEETIRFMFRDIPNLDYQVIPQLFYNRWTILPYVRSTNYNLILIGYERLNPNISFERSFYQMFNVPFTDKWNKFHVKRDPKREKALFDKLQLKEGEYVFVHEDVQRNQIINPGHIQKEVPIVFATKDLTQNIFDYCYIIEHAAEIHVIESSFMWLCDFIPTNGDLYSHRYTKELITTTLPTLAKKWKVMT